MHSTLVGVFLGLAASLTAQIRDLTTDYSGSILYFASESVVRERPTTQHTKIFRWTRGSGLEVYLERPYERQPLQPGRPGDYQTNYFNVSGPHVSQDGRQLALLEQNVVSRTFGGDVVGWRSTINTSGSRTAEVAANERSRPALSANGDYLVVGSSVFNTSGGLVGVGSWSVGSLGEYPHSFQLSRQRIANDRSLVGVDADHIVRVSGPGSSARASSEPAMVPVIDPTGTIIVYETLFQRGVPRRLIAINIATGSETLLCSDPEPEGAVTAGYLTAALVPPRQAPFIAVPSPVFGHSVSADGGLFLAIARDGATLRRQWLVLGASDGSASRRFAFAAEGYREVVLSSDGCVVFAVTELGRLLRIDAASGDIEELLPRTPWIERWSGVLSAGAVVSVIGGGFVETAALPERFPAPVELAGVTVEMRGKPMPITWVEPGLVQFQVPWETAPPIEPNNQFTVTVSFQAPSPLTPPALDAGPTSLLIPVFTRGVTGRAIAFDERGFLHDDGSPVSLANPVRSGETLTVHVTGLGEPSTPTGVPFDDGPFDSPEWLQCALEGGLALRAPATLLGFRPAPGRIGWHQIRLAMPPSEVGAGWLLRCRAGDGLSARVWLPFEQ